MNEMNRREALKKVLTGVAGAAVLTAVAVARAASPAPAAPNHDHGRDPDGACGACSKCNCRHFEGNTYTCANSGCGHAYRDHY